MPIGMLLARTLHPWAARLSESRCPRLTSPAASPREPPHPAPPRSYVVRPRLHSEEQTNNAGKTSPLHASRSYVVRPQENVFKSLRMGPRPAQPQCLPAQCLPACLPIPPRPPRSSRRAVAIGCQGRAAP